MSASNPLKPFQVSSIFRRLLIFLLLFTINQTAGITQEALPLPEQTVNRLPVRIAFGSCANQTEPQPVLKTAFRSQPDIFIYLGDNVSGDTRNKRKLRNQYQ
ncbi:MAG: hypothetical protein P8N76_15065 [Pirellulaceae bacterium]|nr:hypothetical protein [Pirellulaceae bacterium]